ncbi:hypothetical protein QVD17_27375 [Tagetes erecta]|uniref:BZIP domain-containing protein n=1 Tax=Tagetes erecta TaxID=13708 RepID=A0AAD8NRB1_TARER|nr:hypothetical protein QVD17_27375 [Tagetes erecta]
MVTNSGLNRQSSKHALTFDELQNTLGGSGKDFGSMSMDELLKNIWTSEERLTMEPKSDLGVNLQKQGSLTLPRTLGPKTVDEVWKELIKDNGEDVNLIKEPYLQPQEKQPALSEMTLEEFLRKAGVGPENGQNLTNGTRHCDETSLVCGFKNNPNKSKVVSSTEVNNLQGVRSSKQPTPQKILPKQAALNLTSTLNLANKAQTSSGVNGVSIYGKIDNPIHVVNGPQLGGGVNGVSIIGKVDHPTKSNLMPRSPSGGLFPNSNLDTSPSTPSYAYGEGGGVRRGNVGASLEKVVERRQKRMIKNRESAARSRARKQAYTLELEAEVAKLKRINQELQKKQEEIMESHNFQVPERMKLSGNRKPCLRRTVTGPW